MSSEYLSELRSDSRYDKLHGLAREETVLAIEFDFKVDWHILLSIVILYNYDFLFEEAIKYSRRECGVFGSDKRAPLSLNYRCVRLKESLQSVYARTSIDSECYNQIARAKFWYVGDGGTNFVCAR